MAHSLCCVRWKRVSDQFDAALHLDETSVVKPLERDADAGGKVPGHSPPEM
jgi:hypothetical protein